MILTTKTSLGSYDIVLERGALFRAGELLDLKRKVLVVTDDGVPREYAESVASVCESCVTVTLPQGEASKNLTSFEHLLRVMTENGFTRSDCVVAVGGGVVGDLAGFASSVYMRGIDFYNIPTTFLSQVDSSIGGKTAVDFMGYKNIVGAFWPPKKVIIDPDLLKTLPYRQLANGLAESVKMALTNDREMFELFESSDITDSLDIIIERSLLVKKSVVEADERESGLRRVLNFGHTIAHAVESANSLSHLYHGECVAIGMVPMCNPSVRDRLIRVLKKLGLPYEVSGESAEMLITAASHDKKLSGNDITVVYVPEVGEFEFKKIPFSELETLIRESLK